MCACRIERLSTSCEVHHNSKCLHKGCFTLALCKGGSPDHLCRRGCGPFAVSHRAMVTTYILCWISHKFHLAVLYTTGTVTKKKKMCRSINQSMSTSRTRSFQCRIKCRTEKQNRYYYCKYRSVWQFNILVMYLLVCDICNALSSNRSQRTASNSLGTPRNTERLTQR